MGIFFFFFFQAEDGIRDWSVTGVQTCALPIWIASEADALKHVPDADGQLADSLKGYALAWVQIEDEPVRLIKTADARVPRVTLYRAQVSHVEQRRGVVADDIINLVALLYRKPLCTHIRGRFVDIMLVKEWAFDAVGITLHDERAIFQVRQDVFRHLVVIAYKIALCVTLLRPEDLIKARERNDILADLDTGIPAQLF